MESSIVSVAMSAVQQAIAAAKAAASIHSLSRVVRGEVGVQLMHGMETGIGLQVSTAQKMRESVANVISGSQAVMKPHPIGAPVLAVAGDAPAIDYERMTESFVQGATSRPIYFSVGTRQLATVIRDLVARQQAVRVNQINSGYGGSEWKVISGQ